ARVLAFTTLVTVVAAVVAGLMPALKATRPDLTSELKGEVAMTRTAGVRWSMRDALVGVQIAMTLVLLVTSGLLTRSLNAAQHIQLGFNPGGIAVVPAETGMIGYDDARAADFFARALDRVKALPDVTAAGL